MRNQENWLGMLASAGESLRGEQKIETGEDSGWTLLGAIRSNESIIIRDDSNVPMVKITVEVAKNMPLDFHRQTLPVLAKRSEDGDLLRVSIRFDDPSMPFSNQVVSTADKGAFSKSTQELKDTLLKILG